MVPGAFETASPTAIPETTNTVEIPAGHRAFAMSVDEFTFGALPFYYACEDFFTRGGAFNITGNNSIVVVSVHYAAPPEPTNSSDHATRHELARRHMQALVENSGAAEVTFYFDGEQSEDFSSALEQVVSVNTTTIQFIAAVAESSGIRIFSIRAVPQTPVPETPAPTGAPAKKSNIGLIIGIVVAVVVVLALIAIVVKMKSGGDKPNESESLLGTDGRGMSNRQAAGV